MPINESFFTEFPILKTKRLVLRNIQLDDAKAIYNMRSNGMVNRFINREAMDQMEQSEEIVKKVQEMYAQKAGLAWAGILRNQGDIIGTCGFNSIDHVNLRAEIGGELNTHYWGKEIALEAIQSIVQFGFDQLGLHSIEAKVNPDNRGAIRLLEFLKFEKEAHFKERVLFRGQFSDMAVYSCFGTKA